MRYIAESRQEKIPIHLRLDYRLIEMMEDYACRHRTAKSNLIAEVLAERLDVELNSDFTVKEESLKEWRLNQLDEQIHELEKEKEKLLKQDTLDNWEA